ncbi:hypothetical protein F5Y17DRAFT_79848 [Xylariaceae sp. FL0594]|nr:hypothetical protein F5Y17DRAFT_79848 [Xylariaceae sp. FL0594]
MSFQPHHNSNSMEPSSSSSSPLASGIPMTPLSLDRKNTRSSRDRVGTQTQQERPPPDIGPSSPLYQRRASSDDDEESQHGAGSGSGSGSGSVTEVKERWNRPRTNIPRVGACFYSFLVMGANDAAYGVCFSYH